MPVKSIRGIVNKIGLDRAVKFAAGIAGNHALRALSSNHLENILGDRAESVIDSYNEQDAYGQLDFTLDPSYGRLPSRHHRDPGLGSLNKQRKSSKKRRSSRKSRK